MPLVHTRKGDVAIRVVDGSPTQYLVGSVERAGDLEGTNVKTFPVWRDAIAHGKKIVAPGGRVLKILSPNQWGEV
jgi:hypothetical protein